MTANGGNPMPLSAPPNSEKTHSMPRLRAVGSRTQILAAARVSRDSQTGRSRPSNSQKLEMSSDPVASRSNRSSFSTPVCDNVQIPGKYCALNSELDSAVRFKCGERPECIEGAQQLQLVDVASRLFL
ncbi:hypothetical protein OUZ56_023279 [Daphnia magna]|uniref:Uncharacterized protein n=1 Tax=Daphnia magna TaxID=35525 RepID=A0ABR0AYT2_9CRUS|nr:hypothetical protein OUZ56_023279 [Daphnia magna]